MQHRLEEIYRQKAAMGLGYGGCNDQYLHPRGMGQYDDEGEGMEFDGMLGDGVMVGGRRYVRKRRARGGIHVGGIPVGGVGTKKGAYKNPWIGFVQDYAEAHGMKYNEVIGDPEARRQYYELTQGRKAPSKKKPGAKGKTARKPKAAKVEALKPGYRMGPKGRARKLTKYQLARVNKRYTRRNDKNQACVKENRKGPYYLDEHYVCVDYVPPKKKRPSKRKN
jgi:hypothetical protein